ncbi:AbrB family transcriptional regulator [Pseudorhizobium pelagicum]|uniref:AbrB family transcriptional regulator n=1 Tax=Pseudorhizobium pelagicum TaxID=1509405 RepID=UPI0009DFB23D|nr:AbrB family transcriptional regulator [Pseudorhizobium pelagicum]
MLEAKNRKSAPRSRQSLLYTIRTLALGTVGGYVGYCLGIPLGWLLGAMTVTVGLAMKGVRVTSSKRPRVVMIAVIGLMVGSAFKPEVLHHAQEWWMSLAAVAIYTFITAAFGIYVCRRLGKLEPATAALSGMPGGLSEMTVMASAFGADVRSVSMVHATRLVLLIATVPISLTASGAIEALGSGTVDRSVHWTISLSLQDALVLLGCMVIGLVVGPRLRLPAANLTGPLILSAAAHLSGLTEAAVPGIVLAAAQVVIGASIGQSFAGVERRVLANGVLLGLALTAFSLALAVGFALLFEFWLDIPFAIALLALVPGGLPEMSLIAISLDADPAFVGLHHLCRVMIIVISAPMILPVWLRLSKAESGGS